MIGELDQRASLQAKVLTPDGGGGYAESWQIFASVWVKVAPVGANDNFGPDALESRVRHRLALRRRTDVAAGQRNDVRVEAICLIYGFGEAFP